MIRLHPPQTGNKSSQKPNSSSSTNSSRYRHSESHQNEGTTYLSSQKVTDILQAKKEEKKEKSVLIFEMKYQIATSSVLFSFSHFGNNHKKFLSLSFTNVFIYYFYLIFISSITFVTFLLQHPSNSLFLSLFLSLSLILFLHSSFFFYQTIIHLRVSKFVCFEAFI
ncbi:unnamed protein product [Acanthosepion pharaonis]|uniref:Uncharacterized protein n=1 Tax=Acanthosepion pharaonis TaxID=158019 RepID=A0A812EN42_ACAPH|nr:unnamed protein product [Sepia pharaonis]